MGPLDRLGAINIFTFPLLNVNRTFRGEVIRQRTLVQHIFGQKQTDVKMCGAALVTLVKRKQDQLKK